MYEPDVFVVLKPRDGKNRAQSAFQLTHNTQWFRAGTGGIAERATIGSRDVTPADNSDSEDEDKGDRLVVTFSELMRLPNLSNGLQAGTDISKSHILLGHRGTKGISGQQYSIAVDEDLRIWLHDYTSTHGTAVGYSGQNEKDLHKKDTWILAYQPGKRNRFGDITINCGGLVTAVEFPNHTVQKPDPKYIESLKAFAAECKSEAVPAVEGLDLDTQPSTQAPSEAHTVSDRLVYYKEKKIGSGSFAQVYKLIRARDGKVVAAKIFTKPAGNKKRPRAGADPEWLTKIRREYALIKENPHVSTPHPQPRTIVCCSQHGRLECLADTKKPNVIQVFELRETPEVMITMPYYPSGSIAQAGITAEEKVVTAFGQILDCLRHLHLKNIVHRDLKPENILVELVPYFKIVVTDFGLSKAIEGPDLLRTFCGTPQYLAPEVFPGCSGYGASPDVWSLAVMVLTWLHGIPEPSLPPVTRPECNGVPPPAWVAWARDWEAKLRGHLEEEEEPGQVFDILDNMLVWGKSRWSASRCLSEGFENGLFKRRHADGLVMCTNDEEEAIDSPQAASQPLVMPASSVQCQDQGQTISSDEATTIIVDARVGIW